MSQRMLFASCLAIGMIEHLEFKPIHDTDIFWQVRLGQIMLRERRIPIEDRFTYTHAGEPAPPIGWLAQGLFASFYDAGGWRLARMVHHCALIAGLLAGAAACRKSASTPISTAVAMTIGFLVILSNADLRPQSLALACFGAVLAIARSRLSFALKLTIAAPLLIAWQNMHPSVVVGVVALAGLSVADWLEKGSMRRSSWQLVVMTALAVFAQFATPLHAGVFDVARTNLRISRDVLHLAEWEPPWDSRVIAALSAFWVALLGSLVAVLRLWKKLSRRDLVLFFVMTILSLYAARFIIFWAVALVPFWAQVVEQVIPDGMFTWARGPDERRVRVGRSMLGLFAASVVLIGGNPARFQPIIEPAIPLEAVKALRTHLPATARIYNDYVWAGPLILEGSPAWRVAVDGRLYFFADPSEWRSIEEARAGRIPLDELERKHRPDAFFLYPADDWPLIEAIAACPRWQACFTGPTCVAFVRAH